MCDGKLIVNAISWANTNSGFLLVLLTTVYVFTTIAILLSMAKSNKLVQRGIQQTASLEKSRVRPYMAIYMKFVIKNNGNKSQTELPPSGFLFLKNFGLSQAYNVSVSITPTLFHTAHADGGERKFIPYFIENEIGSIAPGETLSDNVGFIGNIFKNIEHPVFKGEITYNDSDGAEYLETFVLDILSMKDSVPYIEERYT